MERRTLWPQQAQQPVERQWSLLGLGLCPRAKGRPVRRHRESVLQRCLLRCAAHPRCPVVAFSQRRVECLIGLADCEPAALSKYTSYASFVPAGGEPRVTLERVEVGSPAGDAAGGSAIRVYTLMTPRMAPLRRLLESSLNLSGDAATLFVKHEDEWVTPAEVAARPDPSLPGPGQFARRQELGIQLLVQAAFDSLGAGASSVILTDIDVNFYPGWADLVEACTTAATVCLTQRPGLFDARSFPINFGFLALRADHVALSFVLDLAAAFEPHQFLPGDDGWEPVVDQDVLADFVFQSGAGMWAVFNPDLVRIFLNVLPTAVLALRVHHACGSEGGDKQRSLLRARRMFWGLYPLCVPVGPLHPCCVLYGYQGVSWSPAERRPPFAKGSLYGRVKALEELQEVELHSLGQRATTFGVPEEWDWVCQRHLIDSAAAWNAANPTEDV